MMNLFSEIPNQLNEEVFQDLLKNDTVRIERILSKGQSSPENGWYEQDENEWVLVLSGAGRLLFDDGEEVELKAGDYLHIPAHKKHKVAWTDPEEVTIWLAIFYK